MPSNDELIVDLDGTILLPLRRKVRSFLEAAKELDNKLENDLEKKARETYDFKAIKREFSSSKALDDLIFDKFLSNELLVKGDEYLDDPAPGAVEFLNKAVESGCAITYLTGRHYDKVVKGSPAGGMVSGTLKTLEHYGFPVPGTGNVKIIFKKGRKRDDTKYKIEEINKILESNKIAAILDDNAKFIMEASRQWPSVQKIGILTWGDSKIADFGCVEGSQRRLTEFGGQKMNITSNECIRDLTSLSASDGCKITARALDASRAATRRGKK